MIKILTTIFLLFQALGCGNFFSDKKKDDQNLYKIKETCSINTENLKEILEKNIEDEFSCLKISLEQFQKSIKTKNNEAIYQNDLSRFISIFFPEDVTDSENALELLFELNSIFLNDVPGQISTSNIPLIIKLLKITNRNAITFNKIFKDINLDKQRKKIKNNPDIKISPKDFIKDDDRLIDVWKNRILLKKSLNSLANNFLKIMPNQGKSKKHLDIIEFINDLISKFDQIQLDQRVIEIIPSIKKLFLSGHKQNVTHKELKLLLSKLPNIVIFLYDFIAISKDDFNTNNDFNIFKLTTLKNIHQYFETQNPKNVIIELNKLANLINHTFKDSSLDDNKKSTHIGNPLIPLTSLASLDDKREEELDVVEIYLDSLTKTFSKKGRIITNLLAVIKPLMINNTRKKVIVKNKNSKKISSAPNKNVSIVEKNIFLDIAKIYTFEDIQKIVNIAIEYQELQTFNNLTWEYYSKKLSKDAPVKLLRPVPTNLFKSTISKEKLRKLHRNFSFILTNYRFYREQNGPQYYTHDYKRNKDSFLEMALFRWFFFKIGTNYSEDTNNTANITINNLEFLLHDFKSLLKEYDLWSPVPKTFARNTVLLADLFQWQSNGDLKVNRDEAAEYFILVANALKAKDQVTKLFLEKCPNHYGTKEAPAFHVTNCFRKNFIEIIFGEKLNYQKYMPQLYSYYDKHGEKEFKKFLYRVEYFARDVADDDLPIGPRDMTLILGAIFNIESTFIRFDTNKNNILDPSEIDTAFLTYKNSIITLANDRNMKVKGFEKSIFLYLLKNMKMPKTWELIKFHSLRFLCLKGNFTAKRENIGSILYYLIKTGNKD